MPSCPGHFSKIRLLHMCSGIKDYFSTEGLEWICEKNGPMRVNVHPLWALNGDQVILELHESLHLLQRALPGYFHWCQVSENNRLVLLFSPFLSLSFPPSSLSTSLWLIKCKGYWWGFSRIPGTTPYTGFSKVNATWRMQSFGLAVLFSRWFYSLEWSWLSYLPTIAQ